MRFDLFKQIKDIYLRTRVYGDTVARYKSEYEVVGKSLRSREILLRDRRMEAGLEEYSFPHLPDISKFDISLGTYNPLLLIYGILGRYSPKITLYKGRNRRANKYLLHIQGVLLQRLINGEPSVFWRLSIILIKRSNVYLVGCLAMIDKNYYRNIQTKLLMKRLETINIFRGHFGNALQHSLETERVYIPKGDTFRPLGVPPYEFRVYLNMLLHPLTMFCQASSNQHGFRPGYGTGTAWKDVILKALPSDNIYEIDLKQAFPTINLIRLRHRLINKYKMPSYIANLYIALNFTPPQFKGLIQLNETAGILLNEYIDGVMKFYGRKPTTFPFLIHHMSELDIRLDGWFSPVRFPNIYLNHIYSLSSRSLAYLGIDPEIFRNFIKAMDIDKPAQYNITKMFNTVLSAPTIPESGFVNHDIIPLQFLGTAQGSPLSPYLSALAFEEITEMLPQGVNAIFYADDFLLYGPKTEEYVDSGAFYNALGDIGFTQNIDKSGWIKRNKVIIKENLKFLGLTYNMLNNTLRASTRNGSSLLFSKQHLIDADYDITLAMNTSEEELMDKESSSFYNIGRGYSYRALLARDMLYYWSQLLSMKQTFGKTRILYDFSVFFQNLTLLPTHIIDYVRESHLLRFLDGPVGKYFINQVYNEHGTVKVIVFTEAILSYGQELGKMVFSMIFGNWENRHKLLPLTGSGFPLGWFALDYKLLRQPYLPGYRNKYTFINFVNSKLYGLVLSRLYIGNWNLTDLAQDFRFQPKPKTIGRLLNRLFPEQLNVFTGTSYAHRYLLESLRKQDQRYKRRESNRHKG